MKTIDVKPLGLFGSRKNLKKAQEYMMEIIQAMPEEERLPILTGFYVFWNTLALNYTLTEKENR